MAYLALVALFSVRPENWKFSFTWKSLFFFFSFRFSFFSFFSRARDAFALAGLRVCVCVYINWLLHQAPLCVCARLCLYCFTMAEVLTNWFFFVYTYVMNVVAIKISPLKITTAKMLLASVRRWWWWWWLAFHNHRKRPDDEKTNLTARRSWKLIQMLRPAAVNCDCSVCVCAGRCAHAKNFNFVYVWRRTATTAFGIYDPKAVLLSV